MDAITLLKQDHKTVEKLFRQFEKSTRPAGNHSGGSTISTGGRVKISDLISR